VVPALLMVVGLCVVVFLLVRRQPGIRHVGFSWSLVAQTGKRVVLPLGAPVVILGGILGGLFTPTEAAAVGAAYMMALGFGYRRLAVRDLPKIFVETALTTASIMLIVSSAALLGYVLALERVPQALSQLVLGMTDDGTVFLLLVLLLMLVLGTVGDATPILVLVVPILMPIAAALGVDPLVLGVVMIISLMIGLLSPPVGTVLFVLSSTQRVPVGEVFRGVLPFIVPLILVCVLIIFFPGIATWLPAQLGL
jgi:tripartite ATP-independent transporter DctM subunit